LLHVGSFGEIVDLGEFYHHYDYSRRLLVKTPLPRQSILARERTIWELIRGKIHRGMELCGPYAGAGILFKY
jgi:hypothetical protein